MLGFKVRMLMMIDLKDSSVITFRDTTKAVQNYETHKLTFYQVRTLRNLIATMPAGVTAGRDSDCVYISFQLNGRWRLGGT